MCNVRQVVAGMSVVNDPMNTDFRKIEEFGGFEIWKGNKGNRDFIYTRYTAFGKPIIFEKVGIYTNSVGAFQRMVFYRTPYTSAKAFKSFVKEHVEGY